MVRTVIPFPGKAPARQASSAPEDEALRLVEAMGRAEEGEAPEPASDSQTRAELEAVWDAAGWLEAEDFATSAPSDHKATRRFVWRIAGGMAAAAVLGFGVYLMQRPDVYETPVGGHRALVLADGSRVTLNTASRIEVRGRTVALRRGEALFEVAHKPDAAPFDVLTDQARIRVTGTRFNVRLKDGRTGVDLIRGHVRVSGKGAPQDDETATALEAGQAVEVATGGRVGPVRAADVAAVEDWLSGRLTFDNTPLKEAVAEMNRYSPVKLVIADAALNGLMVNGEFQAGDVRAFSRAVHVLNAVPVTEGAGRIQIGS